MIFLFFIFYSSKDFLFIVWACFHNKNEVDIDEQIDKILSDLFNKHYVVEIAMILKIQTLKLGQSKSKQKKNEHVSDQDICN